MVIACVCAKPTPGIVGYPTTLGGAVVTSELLFIFILCPCHFNNETNHCVRNRPFFIMSNKLIFKRIQTPKNAPF